MEIKDEAMVQSSLPRRQVVIAIAGVTLSVFITALYQTIVTTAMPRIITDLGGFSRYTWVMVAFMITSAVVTPIAGKLSDMYGRKWLCIAGMVIFVIGSFLCGISQTMTQLIIFRGFQGIGQGTMMVVSIIVIADIFPPIERGKYIGIVTAAFGVASVVGPALGGYLTDYLSWRWCFFVNIPIGILVILLFIFFFPNIRTVHKKRRLDYPGAATMTLAIVPMMLALTWGGVEYGWLSAAIIGMFGFSVAMFIAFCIIESRSDEPIVPLHLFKNQVVSISLTIMVLMSFGMLGSITFIPLYFQGVLGTSAMLSGSFMTPMMLSNVVGSVISGQVLSRTGGHYRIQGAIGLMIMAIGLFQLSRMTVETSYTTAIMNIILTGLGTGIILPLHIIAVQNVVPNAILGAATAMVSLARPVGSVFGLAIAGSILNNRFGSEFMGNLPSAVKTVISPAELASIADNPQALVNMEARVRLQNLFAGLGVQGPELFEQMLLTLRNALNTALSNIFFVVFGVVTLAFIVNFFLKEIPLRRHVHDEAPTELKA